MAQDAQLDFLEIVGPDGKIVSSAQWPARFGYPESAATIASTSFLKREELPDIMPPPTIPRQDAPVALASKPTIPDDRGSESRWRPAFRPCPTRWTTPSAHFNPGTVSHPKAC